MMNSDKALSRQIFKTAICALNECLVADKKDLPQVVRDYREILLEMIGGELELRRRVEPVQKHREDQEVHLLREWNGVKHRGQTFERASS